MEPYLADLFSSIAPHLGAVVTDTISQTLAHVTNALGHGFDIQSQIQPRAPMAVPTVPVDQATIPGARSAGSFVGAAGPAGKHDLSVVALFLQADWVVKTVMILLIMASVWCWTIIFEKLLKLRDINRRADKFEENFWSGGSLEDLYQRVGSKPRDPMAAVFVAGMREWRLSAKTRTGSTGGPQPHLTQRIERVMGLTVNREVDTLERRLGFLASTGSVAPFVGLFGTVWGIMSSFSAIGHFQDTSLATVAPGIAEALFATALGLLAAIPAVIAYNKLSSEVDRYAGRLETFQGEFSAILTRQLDDQGD